MTLRRAYWIVFALTMATYLTMLGWTLPAITDAAAGLPPFDLRPMGYSPDEARIFLNTISDQGRALYLGPQHLLDLFYPALLALVLAGAAWVLIPWRVLGILLIVMAVLGAAADYVENSLVAAMLKPKGPFPDDLIVYASRATVAKSALTTVVMIAVIIGLLRAALKKWVFR